jgi:hypothetical protein
VARSGHARKVVNVFLDVIVCPTCPAHTARTAPGENGAPGLHEQQGVCEGTKYAALAEGEAKDIALAPGTSPSFLSLQ